MSNQKTPAAIEEPKGKLGVLLVGLGAVSTTFIAGVAAINRSSSETTGFGAPDPRRLAAVRIRP